jgi:predicted protein tyrosine phosphatase
MIESISIMPLSKAVDVPFKKPVECDLWISANDPEDRNKVMKLKDRFYRMGIPHFTQFFRDWSDEDPEVFIRNRIDKEGPQVQHVNNIISFLEPYVKADKKYRLGINCFAGISRSTAIGVIAWVMQGMSPMEALIKILEVRVEAWPNLRMLKAASARLGVDIFTPISEWKQLQKDYGIVTFGEKTE